MGTITVKKGTTAPVDITKFILECSPIPITTRNRDYTLVAEPVNIVFTSQIYNETAPTGTFSINTGPIAGADTSVLQFKNNDTYIYTGKVESIEQNYGQGTFNITLVHPFQRLKEYYWYTNDMDAYLDTEKQTYQVLDHTNPSTVLQERDMITIHGLFAACFLRIGFLYDSSSCVNFPEYRRTANGLDWAETSLIPMDMIYAINQTFVSQPANYGTVAAIKDRLTVWDVVSFYAQVFRMNFRFSKYNTVYAFRNQLGKDVVQDTYTINTVVSSSQILEYSYENIPKYFPAPSAVSFNYYLGTTGSYSNPFNYLDYYQSPYIWDARNNTNITTDGKYDDYRQSEFLNNVVFIWVTNFTNSASFLDNAYSWWAGGGATSIRNDANETIIRDNNVIADERMTVIGLDLVNVKPVESVYLIPNNYHSGSEVCEIQQFLINISAD